MATLAQKSAASSETQSDGYLTALGERVRNARARRGMTRRNLASESGVSERFLAQLEAGDGNISIIRLRQIATAMNISLGDLVRDEPARPIELNFIAELLYPTICWRPGLARPNPLTAAAASPLSVCVARAKAPSAPASPIN